MGVFKTICGIVLLTILPLSPAHAQYSFDGYSLDQLKAELSEAQVYQALAQAKAAADGPRGCYQYNDEMFGQRQVLLDLNVEYADRADTVYEQKRTQAQEQFRLAERLYADCYTSTLADYPVLSAANVRGLTDFRTKVAALNPKYSTKGDIVGYIAAIEDAIENIGNQRGKRVGVIESIFKQVDVLRGGEKQWTPLSKGAPIFILDELKTGPRGRLRIKFDDRFSEGNAGPTVVNIGSSSHIKIERFLVSFDNPKKREGVIGLLRGSIRAFTKNWGSRSQFAIRAGATVCGIRGTEVAISYDPATGEAVHTLDHGDAFVEADGQRITLKPRTSLSVRGSEIGALRDISDATWSGLVDSTSANGDTDEGADEDQGLWKSTSLFSILIALGAALAALCFIIFIIYRSRSR
ncbi:FecR domain-containing protein [Parasphingorhabdus sp.]|uniref:FecR family protein n=1 Tax=Parasphingorhabdus sp. TaxID=2709688 RepID=UPI00326501B4